MKTVSGKVVSSKPISLSKAAKILSNFVSVDNGASQAVQVYLRRASASFADLVQVHKDIKTPHSDRKIRKRNHIRNQTLEKGEPSQQVHNYINSSHSGRKIEKQNRNIEIDNNETQEKAELTREKYDEGGEDRSENAKAIRKHKKHRTEEKIEEFDERIRKDERKIVALDEGRDKEEDSVRKREKKWKKHKGVEREDERRDSVNKVKDQEKIEELDERMDNAEDSVRKRDKKAKKHKHVEREAEGNLGVEDEEERKEKKNKKKRKNRETDGGDLVLDSAEQSGLKKKKRRKTEVEE